MKRIEVLHLPENEKPKRKASMQKRRDLERLIKQLKIERDEVLQIYDKQINALRLKRDRVWQNYYDRIKKHTINHSKLLMEQNPL